MTNTSEQGPADRSLYSKAARAGVGIVKWLAVRIFAVVRWIAGAIRRAGSLAVARFKESRAAPRDVD